MCVWINLIRPCLSSLLTLLAKQPFRRSKPRAWRGSFPTSAWIQTISTPKAMRPCGTTARWATEKNPCWNLLEIIPIFVRFFVVMRAQLVALVFLIRLLATRRPEPTATAPSRAWHSPTCRWSCALWARRWRWSSSGRNTKPWSSRSPYSSPSPRGPASRRRQRANHKWRLWSIQRQILLWYVNKSIKWGETCGPCMKCRHLKLTGNISHQFTTSCLFFEVGGS